MDEVLKQMLMAHEIQKRRFTMPGPQVASPTVDMLYPWNPLPDDWYSIGEYEDNMMRPVERTLETLSPKQLRERGVKP